MQEIWKDIPNYEGIYQVSNFGNVKSLSRLMNKGKAIFVSKEKIMSKHINKDGYYCVTLKKDKKSRTNKNHQLVAIAFLNHTPDGTLKLVVDHINDNRLDNRLENLQIITQRENVFKTQGKYSSKYKGVNWYKKYNKWRASININGKSKHLGYFTNEYDAHVAYQKALDEIKKEGL